MGGYLSFKDKIMFIQHHQAQLLTVSFGAGPRTLLAHGGWVGSWELWAQPFTHLSQTWRTVAYDHRGTGATIAPLETITWANLVDDLLAVMDALKIEQCVLAGESAGAAVVLQAALAHPERYTGLVLVDGLFHQPRPTGPDMFLQGLKSHYQATLQQFVNTCTPEPDSEAIRRWGMQIVNRAEQAAAIQLYEMVYGLDLRPHLSTITLPTLIIHGEKDALVSVSAAQWLAEQLPNSQLHILPGAGHVPTMTRPREVATLINQFFAP